MIDYIKNIIPRIQRYSKDLSKIENFIDKNWIFIDENGKNHEYLFLRDKRLIMTLGSITKEGSWELLPTGQLLITRDTNDLVKLENMFVEQALLVLKKSATDDIPFVLINKQLIPDLDAVKYLEKFEHKKYIEDVPLTEQKYRLFKSGEIFAPNAYVGKIIKTFDDVIFNGTYKTTDDYTEKYIIIENNKITRIYFHEKYRYNNQDLVIEVKNHDVLDKGDIIILTSNNQLPIGQKFTIVSQTGQNLTIKINSESKIIMTQDEEVVLIIKYTIVSLLIIIFLLIIFSINK
jgi:hypothetical protein